VRPQSLAHRRRRRHRPLHLPLRVSRDLVRRPVVRRIDHGQRQVPRAVEVRWDHSKLGGHMRRHRRQDVARHTRKRSSRYARNAQVLLKRRDEVFLIQQSQAHDGFTDRSPIALLKGLSSL
jgi:hypothetical protein